MGVSRAKKTSKAQNPTDDEGTCPPSSEQWKNMAIFKSFTVCDSEGNEFKFEKEQVVLVLPHGFDPDLPYDHVDYWIAKIKEIRAEVHEDDDSNSVWTKVQWYYSGKDVSDVVKSFDRNAIGEYERIFSDHYDYIQPEAIEAAIPMYKLNEVDPDQRYIPNEEFYRRYTFEYRARNLQPKPGLQTCVCHIPYNPNDTDPLNLMHFCPRPSCRKAYHHQCLWADKSKESLSASKKDRTAKIPSFEVSSTESDIGSVVIVKRSARKHAAPPPKVAARKTKSVKKIVELADEQSLSISPISLSSRAYQLLACSPDSDDVLDLQGLIPRSVSDSMDIDSAMGNDGEREPPTKKRRRGHPLKARPPPKIKKADQSRSTRPSLAEVLSTLPKNLIEIATQPLVRGGAFPAGGVAGNIGMVTQARRLVYAALQMGGGKDSVSEDWEDKVFGDDRKLIGVGIENAVVVVEWEGSVRGKKDRELPPFLCPNCKSAI